MISAGSTMTVASYSRPLVDIGSTTLTRPDGSLASDLSEPSHGDAEMIAVLSVGGGLGELKHCGSIDSPAIKELVNDVMEGSREAFALRRERYGF